MNVVKKMYEFVSPCVSDHGDIARSEKNVRIWTKRAIPIALVVIAVVTVLFFALLGNGKLGKNFDPNIIKKVSYGIYTAVTLLLILSIVYIALLIHTSKQRPVNIINPDIDPPTDV